MSKHIEGSVLKEIETCYEKFKKGRHISYVPKSFHDNPTKALRAIMHYGEDNTEAVDLLIRLYPYLLHNEYSHNRELLDIVIGALRLNKLVFADWLFSKVRDRIGNNDENTQTPMWCFLRNCSGQWTTIEHFSWIRERVHFSKEDFEQVISLAENIKNDQREKYSNYGKALLEYANTL